MSGHRTHHNRHARHKSLPALLLLSLLLLSSTERCEAHPASHVDAWARVGTNLDLRIIVFLDNVLAWQDIEQHGDSTLIPAESAQRALQRFEQSLPALLTIHDPDGQQLQPQILKRPRWSPADRGVDLAADGALRLTWQLQYPWQPEHRSLLVRHAFTKHLPAGQTVSSDWQTPCELRLRVRCETSRRRVDTVVADHQPHTVVLPELSLSQVSRPQTPAEPKAEQADSKQSSARLPRARFVLLPGRLIHEFSLPLSDIRAAVFADSDGDTPDATKHAVDIEALSQQAIRWMQRDCELRIDGVPAAVVAIDTELLTSDDELLSDQASAVQPELRLGIRTTHQLQQRPRQLTASWTSGLQAIHELQLETLCGDNASTTILSSTLRDSLASDGLTYSWEVPIPDQRDAAGNEQQIERPADRVSSSELWVSHPQASGVRQPLATGIAVVMLCVSFCVRKKWRFASAVGMIALILAVVLSGGLPGEQRQPDSSSAAAMLTEMLNRVYPAVLISDERTMVDELSEVLSEDLVETVYQQAAVALNDADSNAPVVRIGNVRMLRCSTAQYKAPDWASFHCEWQVDGQVLHWGHRHQRKMLITATIRVESGDDGCRIAGISVDGTKSLATGAQT